MRVSTAGGAVRRIAQPVGRASSAMEHASCGSIDGGPRVRVPSFLRGRAALTASAALAVCTTTACDDNGTGPLEPTMFTAVATGARHTCGLDDAGTAYCWGNGTAGELGNGGFVLHVIPQATTATVPFAALSAGSRHTCALTESGDVQCWGWNFHGQLGNGTTVDLATPIPIASDRSFVEISSGWFHTCGVTTARELFCWGANGQGQLGDGTTTDRTEPVRIASTRSFSYVSAGGYHTCAVATNGEAFCWGLNNQGQLGDGTQASTLLPRSVDSALRFASVAAGYTHSCGLTANGIPYCWGSNGDGELGVAFASQPGFVGSFRPAAVHDVTVPYLSLDAGFGVTCGVLRDASGRCWGRGTDGQLGNGAHRSWPAPQPIPSVPDFTELSARGDTHTCGVTSSSAILCWGRGDYGQLGRPGTPASSLPVRVPGVG